MAIRDDFAPGEVLAAADLNDTFDDLRDGLGSKLDVAGGKILQIVRATDTTQRSTTSTSYVDVTGMSVTITPQKSDSAIIIAAVYRMFVTSGSAATIVGDVQITDASNNPISGAEDGRLAGGTILSLSVPLHLWGYSTPATTSATTYKLRFKSNAAFVTANFANNTQTGQMYAIEVSA
jgi:hypothetical protein